MQSNLQDVMLFKYLLDVYLYKENKPDQK